jgi:hypothetical protein
MNNLSDAVLGGIYMPAILGASFVMARMYVAALIIIAVFGALSLHLGVFENWKIWPIISKISVLLMPFLFFVILIISRFPEIHAKKVFL